MGNAQEYRGDIYIYICVCVYIHMYIYIYVYVWTICMRLIYASGITGPYKRSLLGTLNDSKVSFKMR